MKKIPTLFTRVFENRKIIDILPEITPGCEEAFKYGDATLKVDGSCCAIIDGVFYKRYDAKKGKKPPEGAIPCCDPDPITGHHPHWVKVNPDDPSDKWFVEAHINSFIHSIVPIPDGTYEAVGPHFQGNPYKFSKDILIEHGDDVLDLPNRTFKDVREFLQENVIEGIVFWLDGEPVCKIKRTDFGFDWPVKGE